VISDEAHRTQAGGSRATCAWPAQRGLHRLHRHAAVQARRAHQAHLRRLLRLALRLQALRGGRRDRQAGLREPGREAGHRPARPERPHREKIEEAELDPDQAGAAGEAARQGLRGHHRRRPARQDRGDFVEHCATRWESGKSMLVCIDKITCARMYQRIIPRWKAKARSVQGCGMPSRNAAKAGRAPRLRRSGGCAARPVAGRDHHRDHHQRGAERGRDFKKWGFDIIPHRALMKQGFETPGRRAGRCRDGLQGPQAPVPRRHRLRHVADRASTWSACPRSTSTSR
jgi:hypothetical protein